jgi:predicted signal transduction protein with EAL and GGDEF domain
VEETGAPLRDAEGQVLGAVLVLRDVSEQRRLSREMSHRAKHDALTDLVNRQEFELRLARVLEQSKVHGTLHTVLYLDLDQFKLVNWRRCSAPWSARATPWPAWVGTSSG